MALLQQTNQQRSLIGGSKVWKFDRLAASCSGRLCRPSGDAGDASLIAADVASKLPESIALRSNKLCLFLLLDLQTVKKNRMFHCVTNENLWFGKQTNRQHLWPWVVTEWCSVSVLTSLMAKRGLHQDLRAEETAICHRLERTKKPLYKNGFMVFCVKIYWTTCVLSSSSCRVTQTSEEFHDRIGRMPHRMAWYRSPSWFSCSCNVISMSFF